MEEREKLENEIQKANSRILDLKNFLSSKDYQTIREMQGGEPMDEATKTECANARAEINELENRIKSCAESLADLPEEDQRPAEGI